ncbi:hypothetical protein AN958_04533 [Leucoagaricus sp. SymC.cos]|nr:hypothetical protein AN958_04533 [Leucoagaricus sp. SymC.cos]
MSSETSSTVIADDIRPPSDEYVAEIKKSICKKPPTRDDEWYLEDGNVILLIKDRLFKLHRYLLARESRFFSTLLSLPQNEDSGSTNAEGESDDCPIICPSDTVEDFKALCWALYARPADILAQQNSVTADVPLLIRVIALSHKYEFTAYETWAFNVLENLSSPHPSWLIAAQCRENALVLRMEQDWLQRISNSESDGAVEYALMVAETSGELRQFHGKVYYTFLRAKGVFSAEAQETVGSTNLVDAASAKEDSLTVLTSSRKRRLQNGFWSLAQLRLRLAHPPMLDNDPPCSGDHSRDCVPGWQAWWKKVLDDSARSGKYLNDPGDLIAEMERQIAKGSIWHKAPGQIVVKVIPCNVRLVDKQDEECSCEINFDEVITWEGGTEGGLLINAQ